MSLLKSIAKIGKKLLKSPIVTTAIGRINPVMGAVVGAAGMIGRASVKAGVPATVVRNLPALAGGMMLPSLGSGSMPGAGHTDTNVGMGRTWEGMPRRRKRRKGISAKDLSSFKRVARMVDKYSKPIHKMRNFKSKKEIV